MIIKLPWMHPKLNPNARPNPFDLARKKKLARKDAATLTIAANLPKPLPFIGERLPMRITFCPPSNHHRDDDNMIAAFKSARDGIADGLGVNDRCFAPHYAFSDPVKGGCVIVEIGA